MKTGKSEAPPICKCGSHNFATATRTRNQLGRLEFKLTCNVCGNVIKVGKTTYALFHYLSSRDASAEFRKLFDLG